MLDESNLDRVHRCAKLCIRHLVSLNRSRAATGRLYLAFDRSQLQAALDEAHETIGLVVERFAAVAQKKQACGVEAKCAHGVVLQIAEDTLCRIDDKEPITNIKWDRRELLNLYAALARELRAAQSARPNTRHSKDFSSVLWFGVPYSFSRAQAGCVKVLWESWEQDTPEIRGEAIVDAIDASTDRTLPRIFTERGKRHQAWGTMIVPGTLHKGTYRLQEPKPPLQKKTRKTPSSPLK